jgi:hypothetical protein
MSVFGFSTEPSSGGDFLPILKYDARAGRFFRVDRVDTGQGFESDVVDVTNTIKMMVDFENIEVGWIDFQPGSAPSFVLVPMGKQLPPKPSDRHKNGLRFMVKLAKDCGGAKPIREVAGTSKAFLSGIEQVYLEYMKQKDANPGKLPVLTLEKTVPIKTGSGEKSSTNYTPILKIIGWAARGDLKFEGKAAGAPTPNATGNGAAPATGATRAVPPQAQQHTVSADDFG